jgi:hypothetical protein
MKVAGRGCSVSWDISGQYHSLHLSRLVQEFVQPSCNQQPALSEEIPVLCNIKNGRVNGNALCFEGVFACFFKQGREVLNGRFIADCSVCFTANKSKVRNIVNITLAVVSRAFSRALGKIWWNCNLC